MPPPPAYLAIDLGASSGRALLGVLADGRVRMTEVRRFATPLLEDGPHLYWDLEALWAEVYAAFRQACTLTDALRSLSVDAWGVDYVPLDADGQALRNPYCYRDPRTDGMMEVAFARVPASEMYAATGIQQLPINTVYQVLADYAAAPERAAQVACRLLIADYLHYRFTGRQAAEVSLASTTGLLNARGRTWDAALMRRLGLRPEAWPRLLPSGTVLGPVRPAYGAADVQVVAGCSHDTAAAVAAVPAAEDGTPWAFLSSGTWSLLGVERTAPLLTRAAFAAGFTNEAGLDGSVRFLKNLTGLWVLQECERAWHAAGDRFTYDALLREAEEAPPAPAHLDLDDPRFGRRGDMLQCIAHYQRTHGQPVTTGRGAVVRLILESLAAAYGRRLRQLEALTGERIGRLHVVGGGARNTLLCRMTAAACGCTVVAGPAEATALGNVLIQARTMGDLPPGTTIRRIARRSTTLATYPPPPADT